MPRRAPSRTAEVRKSRTAREEPNGRREEDEAEGEGRDEAEETENLGEST